MQPIARPSILERNARCSGWLLALAARRHRGGRQPAKRRPTLHLVFALKRVAAAHKNNGKDPGASLVGG